ncbi:hypothetical protein GYH30_037008 [Glycine max]|uniref:Uncharacterized protein n=1 Tax=Glycine max TaxID=3847 RepID=A0A0R0GYH9_SOYBN|nr:hypothetical protein GYH30_037008 [Glycine max]
MSPTSTQETCIQGSSWIVQITLQLSYCHRCLLFSVACTCRQVGLYIFLRVLHHIKRKHYKHVYLDYQL